MMEEDKQIMDLVAEIRAAYPAPKAAPFVFPCTVENYCVFGACQRHLLFLWKERHGFPSTEKFLAFLKMYYNVLLERWDTSTIVREIQKGMDANDAGDFDQAWESLGLVLAMIRQVS